MKRTLFLITCLIILGVGIVLPNFIFPFAPAGSLDDPKTDFVENADSLSIGKITEISSQETKNYDYDIDGDGAKDVEIITKLSAQIRSGHDKGSTVQITVQQTPKEADIIPLKTGTKIIIGKEIPTNGATRYYFFDLYRLNTALIFLVIFLLSAIIFAGRKGVSSFAGLIITMAIIFFGVIPSILAGYSPILVCGLSSFIIVTISIIVAHGYNRRTLLAVLSSIILVILALTLSQIVVTILHLSGLGSEEAFYLQFTPSLSINLQGLLLGGILLGVVGVLDDITTAQSAVVEELHRANQSLTFQELYKRASSVGGEHITSLVNTLVLAYTGASFPLLLLFFIYPRPWWTILNNDVLMEEIARTLVGSIILVLAVPITTAIASLSYSHSPLTKDEKQINQINHHH